MGPTQGERSDLRAVFSGPYAFDGVGQALDGARHGLVGEVPVADDEGGGICLGRGQAIVVQARQAYVRPRRLLHHRARRAVRQRQEQVESGGRPADGLSGQPGREFAQEVVAAAFVAQAGGPQAAVVRAGGDEAGEGVLVDDGRRGASGVPRGEGVGHRSGAAIQPSRTAGERVLLSEPSRATWSGATPCKAPTGWRS